MTIRSSVATLALLTFGALSLTTVGCSGSSAKDLCSKADACGKTPTAEETKTCEDQIANCTDEADDYAACSDGNMECVDGEAQLKDGKCEAEGLKYLACALSGSK